MAKTGALETTNASELKKELQRLVKVILDDEDYSVDAIDEAIKFLNVFKEVKFKKSPPPPPSPAITEQNSPVEFKCPISMKLMSDPVILASGETYDRSFIQRWLNEGNQTCPQTKQVLSHTILVPNLLVREIISQWCQKNGISFKSIQDADDNAVTDVDRSYLISLLEKMSSSLSHQKVAAKELRLLTKKIPSFRELFKESVFITQLLHPLSEGSVNTHPDLLEDLITILLNISIPDNNKRVIAENQLAIPLLVKSLKSGTIDTRRNAAAALFSLSAIESNRLLIGECGALKPLIDLLEEGYLLAMKDAAAAIFNLCLLLENRGRAISEGLIKVILEKIEGGLLVDELLAILAMLAARPQAVQEMGEHGAIPCLLRIIRENPYQRNRENCAAILYEIVSRERPKCKEVLEDEYANSTILRLTETGNSRAKRKASGILEILRRFSSPLFH